MHTSTKYIKVVLLHIVILHTLIGENITCCYAGASSSNQRYSKNYKKFPVGSPEAVVTEFIESDFKDAVDRSLNLTESGDIPTCGFPRLIIKSYQILNKTIDPKTGEVTVNLHLDVRGIDSDGNRNPKDKCSEKIIIVSDEKRTFYSVANTKKFIETVINQSASDSYTDQDYYFLPSSKREWVLPVKMVKKQNRWLIKNGSIPLVTSYIASEIARHTTSIKQYQAIDDVCSGKLSIKEYVRKKLQLDYVLSEIGTDLKRFQAECCTKDKTDYRMKTIGEIMKSVLDLEELEKE